jgi:hypothetical protein
MGCWINNFMEFEKKRGPNRLILNFYYIPEKGEKTKTAKAFIPIDVIVPSQFVHQSKTDAPELQIDQDEILRKMPYSLKGIGSFFIYQFPLPKDPSILNRLPRVFQKGNYDKLLKFGGFFPNRKLKISSALEDMLLEEEECELVPEDLSQIEFGDFVSSKELQRANSIFVDIEKPLWKKEDERILLKEREKLLKESKRYQKNKTKENPSEEKKRIKRLDDLEKKLSIEVDQVGKVNLAEERFNADVSYVTAIWNWNGKRIKEIYVIDSNEEIDEKRVRDYNLLKFKDESSLISSFLKNLHERKPLISYGHNQVYDWTQLREAASSSGIFFDPAIKGVRPRRDFVRQFLQRLKEDLLYFDTLWMAGIAYPHLKQKSFGSSLKLASVAQFLGIPFEKPMSHEDLRYREMQAIAGKTPEIRKKARAEMLDYSAGDVDVLPIMVDEMNFLPIIERVKKVVPFATLTEIAFSSNVMNSFHEYKHFLKRKNLPFHGYSQKQRQDELQIFKKRYPSLKKKMMKHVGFEKAEEGEYRNVTEFLFSLEGAMPNILRRISPEFYRILENCDSNSRISFLQYARSLMISPMTDYYFARREEKNLDFVGEYLGHRKDQEVYLSGIGDKLGWETRAALLGSFKFLKNHFRSIYVPLKKEGRALIRPIKKNLETIEYPKIMENDADLFLVSENEENLRKMLTPFNQRKLTSFVTNFGKFFDLINEKNLNLEETYGFITLNRTLDARRRFSARYGFPVETLKREIGSAYRSLFDSVKNSEGRFLEQRGDYLFIENAENIPNCVPVRKLENYSI